MKKNIFELSLEQLREVVGAFNQPEYRALQIWQGLFQQGWNDFQDFSPLPLELRDQLAGQLRIGTIKLEKAQFSGDGSTRKHLYRLEDGAAIETVIMAYDERQTVCISSQVGCPLACSFCATGNMGFTRNLTRGEIIEQVIQSAALLKANKQTLANVVFMGMGEPFHNYQAVMDAIKILNDPRGLGFGARRFTISTAGLVPEINRFTAERSQVNLAISLHAADDELRSSLMPVNRRYPLSVLLEACGRYIKTSKRRVTIEWALIEGINDSLDQANKLVSLIKGQLYHVNLIQLNPVDHYRGAPAGDDQAREFQKVLIGAGVPCTVRLRRGIDIQAGCGQLASKS